MRTTVLLALLAFPLCLAAQPRVPEEALRGQSSQYQQGFRDGFREAIRMMDGSGAGFQDDRGIRIESARYGSERRGCDFTRKLADQANGKRDFSFRAGNQWCGDPDRGADKVAKIQYSCGRDRRQVQVREDRSTRLRCD